VTGGKLTICGLDT